MPQTTTEKRLEADIVRWAKAENGIAIKGATNFDTGFPDRIIYISSGEAYIEVKGTSTRYHLTDKQMVWAGRLSQSRVPYYVIESEEQIAHMKSLTTWGVSPHDTLDNTRNQEVYCINGDNIYVIIAQGNATCVSTRPTRHTLFTIPCMETVADTIYMTYKEIERRYPNKMYKDI